MKIQERTGAGQGRSAAPAQPSVGDRLPTPPRERKPALAALAVLLILVGALGATMLVLQAGDRIEVVKVTKEIPAGGSVTDSNVTSVMVAEDSSIHYVKWSLLDDLKKLKAVSTIPAGAVAVGEMFGDKVGATQGKTLVGVSLKAGQFPADIKVGDTVAAYRVTEGGSGSGGNSSASATGGNSLIVDNAVVSTVPAASGDELVGSTNSSYTLAVDNDDAGALAQAAANNEVVLVLVPSSN
ncbi:hypothetical protein QF037_004131 [Streptomyces canus]|uniref:hypothetical protein n=1 Tax=Streptomyces canus TaxID=58343 RepID=UPI002785C362|nr:hypothetical protein [Streptomyces canus]MDQ0599786.1 hypothetical protein [Streptomyces canus]